MNPDDHSAQARGVPRFPNGLDDLRATDTCPMCFATTGHESSCRACGLDLADPTLAQVFTESKIAAEALVRRGHLLAQAWRASRARAQAPRNEQSPPVAPSWSAASRPFPAHRVPAPAVSAPPISAPPIPAPPAAAPAVPAPPAPAPPAPAPPSADESTPRRSGIQLVLLIIGVAFVSIAAIVFLTVAFVLFDLMVKALITAGVTAGIIALASWLKRRGLTITAEGIAILGVVLLLLDVWAIRSLDLFGLEGLSPTLYWGMSLITITAILLGWGKAAVLRAPRLASTFTLGPGVFALLFWALGHALSEHAATMVALAGVGIASLLAPIIHRHRLGTDHGSDSLEVGIVYGVGQLATAYLTIRTFQTALVVEDADAPVVAISASAIGVLALLGQIGQLRARRSLAGLAWLRIPATVIATALWSAAMFVIAGHLLTQTPGSIDGRDFWKALPFIALAAVFWDIGHLRSGREDRARWRAGLISAVVILAFPTLWLIAGIGALPFSRASASAFAQYSVEPSLLSAGIAILIGSGIAGFAYLGSIRSARERVSRAVVAAVVGGIGVSIIAVALPFLPALMLLAVLMVASVVGVGLFARAERPALRVILHAQYLSAAAGLLLISFLHTPFGLGVLVVIGLGFLVLRMLRGNDEAVWLTLATSLFSILTTLASWAPNDYPILAAIFTLALPVATLLIATGWRVLHITDRRVLVWTATPLLVLAAAQQLPLAFFRPQAPFADTIVAVFVAMGIATAALCVVLVATLRAARTTHRLDAVTRSVSLVSMIPLGYLVASPFVQLVAGRTPVLIGEVMLGWTLLVSALIIAAALTLLRLRGVPDRWTMAADSLTVITANLALLNLLVLTSPRTLAPVCLLVLGIAIAVPLTVTVRSSAQRPRGRFRGIFPWIAAASLALFGPLFLVRIIDDPWLVLVCAPIALALLLSALVFQVSGSAGRVRSGAWLVGGMLALGTALPLATLLGSRADAFAAAPWVIGALATVLTLAGLVLAAFWRAPPALAATRALLIAVLAPLGMVCTITLALELPQFDDDSFAAYLLAAAVGGSTLLALTMLARIAHPQDSRARTGPPERLVHGLGLAAVVAVAFSALLLTARAVDVALVAWAIALAFVLANARTLAIAQAQRAALAAAQFFAALSALFAASTGELLEHPITAAGAAVIGLAVSILLAQKVLRRNGARPTDGVLRVLSAILVPVGVWSALMAAPVAWPWWMPLAAGTLAVTATVTAAAFRGRLDTASRSAAGAAAILPLVTAPFVNDTVIRLWPSTWLAVGVSLIALGFALRNTLPGTIGPAARALGALIALLASAALLWPEHPEPTVLLVAIPGCLLLALLAVAVILDSQHTDTPAADGPAADSPAAGPRSASIESGGYALALPGWFTGLAVAAGDAVPASTLPIIMVALLCVTVAATTCVPIIEANLDALRIPLQLLAGGSGASALVMLMVSLAREADVPSDLYFLAFGLALTAIGAVWLRARPKLRSLSALGPGLAVMLAPLALLEANDPTPVRIGTYTALVFISVLIGALGRLQAPLVFGSVAAIAHLFIATRWMLPELSVPWWVWLGSAGALLIFVAATYEARLKNAKMLASSIAQLR